MTEIPVIIAGGGIGGLSTAVGLARAGIPSIVLERAAKFGEIGAGIQMAPNAFHCLDYLGIGKQARAEAVYIDALRLMDAKTAEEIASIPLDQPFRDHFKNPYAVVHRSDLHGAMLDFCVHSPLVDLRTNHLVQSYTQTDNAVTATCKGGGIVTGSALIGADGLHSNIRGQMLGDGAPLISGHATYRSVIPTEKMPEDLRWNAATLWAGPKCHIVHYPLKGWKVFNLVVTYHRDVKEPVMAMPVTKDEVRQGFEHIHPKAQQVIEHGENWKLWVLCDRDPVSTWVDGRVALLGDAAHPMLQYFAQGASMAMEDAVALSHSFAEQPTIETALLTYQQRRVVKTARVQMNSRLIGDYIYHPDGAQAMVRDHVMSGMSPADWYRQLGWIYGSNGLDQA